MNRAEQIKAFHQSAEHFQGLELAYDGSNTLKDTIYGVIDDVTLETGMIPKLYEHTYGSIYIEFHDMYSGSYFNNVLGKLGIAHCRVG